MSFGIAFFVISAIAQLQAAKSARKRQKKMEKEAKERADASKGFTISAEGEASVLPVHYGRGMLAGVRVYHNTSHNFVYQPPSAGGLQFNNSMGFSRNGIKHEFLTVQTALAFAGLSNIYYIEVDGRSYADVNFASKKGIKEGLDAKKLMGGHIFNVYLKGNVVDSIANANYGLTGMFTNTAYATSVYALNRDDYQYSGIPEVKYYVEGMAVRSISMVNSLPVLSTTLTYSNNPALCLLDYLMSPIYGRGLTLEYIDLESFYRAYLICEKVVQISVPIEGFFWQNKGGLRTIKLYECNLTISPATTIRNNIETILETMAEAELVWSGGKYKLVLEYPEIYVPNKPYAKYDTIQVTDSNGVDYYRSKVDNNTAPYSNTNNWSRDVIEAYITDRDIVRAAEASVSWPNASERYNYVTVRFLNESENFAEDSVSWPPKTGSIPGQALDRGVWSSTGVYNKSDIVTYNSVKYQLNTGFNYTSTSNPTIAGVWVLYNQATVYNTYRAQDHGLPLEADFFESGITDYWHALAKAEQRVRSSRSSTIYKLELITKHVRLEPGDLIKVNSDVLNIPGEIIRLEEIKVDDNGIVQITGAKFDAANLAWNAKDNEVVKQRNIFDTSIPQCTNLSFTLGSVNSTLSSGTLSWTPPSDIRVNKFLVKYTRAGASEVNDSTDWIDLGETAASTFTLPSMPTNSYTLTVVAIANNNAAPQNDTLGSKWPLLPVGLAQVSAVSISVPVTIYKRSATEPATPTGGVFSFQSLTLTTIPTGWSTGAPAGVDTLYSSTVIAYTDDITEDDTDLTWSFPSVYADSAISVTIDHDVIAIGKNFEGQNAIYTDATARISVVSGNTDLTNTIDTSFSVTDVVGCTVSTNNFSGPTKGLFVVTNLSGNKGTFNARVVFRGVTYNFLVSVIALKDIYIPDLTPPPNVTSVNATVGLNTVFLVMSNIPNYTQGHGHAGTRVYASIGSNSFANAKSALEFRAIMATMARNLNEEVYIWLVHFTRDGIESPIPYGPINVSTRLINENDLAADSVTANKILVTDLGAISANLGEISSGKLYMDDQGLISLGQLNYNVGNGFFVGYEGGYYKFSLGNASSTLTYNGLDLTYSGDLNAAGGTFSGNLNAAGGTFSGELQAASGSFGGNLMAGVLDFTQLSGIRYVFNSPGNFQVSVPPDKTTMRITVLSASGGGGGALYLGIQQTNGGPGGGGAGGGTKNIVLTRSGVAPGAIYNISVGAAGVGGYIQQVGNGPAGNGTAGGNSSVTGPSVSVINIGGAGGTAGKFGQGATAVGIGGTGGSGDNTLTGSNGNPPVKPASSGGGLAGITYYSAGSGGLPAAHAVGKGGKGGNGGLSAQFGQSYSATPGGNGVNGLVIIEFFNPNTVVLKTELDVIISALNRQGIATA